MNTQAINPTRTLVAYRRGFHVFAIALVVATFLLVITGGNVTSKGVGLSVPDWPTVYGYNMFTFPVQKWVGGILDEHVHRLKGSLVGLMAIILLVMAWLPVLNRRFPFRFQGLRLARYDAPTNEDRPAMRWLSLAILVLVIVQGVMGGLRVTEMSTAFAIVHGVHAQIFFCLTILAAAATSRLWIDRVTNATNRTIFTPVPSGRTSSLLPRRATLALLAVLLVQLILGATMRHTGAGVAIPDFPASYGRLVPPLTEQSIHAAIDARPYAETTAYYSPAQVGVHFSHRVWAIAVTVAVLIAVFAVGKNYAGQSAALRPALVLLVLLGIQIALGVIVVLTGRAPNMATAHQTMGAAMLGVATLLAIRVRLLTPTPAEPVVHAASHRAPHAGSERSEGPDSVTSSTAHLATAPGFGGARV